MTYDVVQRRVRSIIFVEDSGNRVVFKEGAHRLVLPQEADTHETIPFAEVNGWRRILGLDSHYARLNLGRRPEIVFADLN